MGGLALTVHLTRIEYLWMKKVTMEGFYTGFAAGMFMGRVVTGLTGV